MLNVSIELPSHNVSTAVSSSVVAAGGTLNLTCVVSASDPLLQLPNVHWSGPTGRVVPPKSPDAVLTGPTTLAGVTHLSLYLPLVRTSQAGDYTCHAVSNITTLTLIKETTSIQLVRVTSE